MRVFRSRALWEYFLAIDKSQSFVFPKAGGIGDGEVRSFSVALLCRPERLGNVQQAFTYRHPVAWEKD
jgi:hypothetical protein